jgi:hypothetical protein
MMNNILFTKKPNKQKNIENAVIDNEVFQTGKFT